MDSKTAKNVNKIRIGLAQMQVTAGEVRKNAEEILKKIEQAEELQLDVLAFPELCLSGYLIGDMWEREAFLRECAYWQQQIIQYSKNTLIVFGNIITEWDKLGEDGRPRKYNGFVVAKKGLLIKNPAIDLDFGTKTLLPNYREFDESRHFYDTRKLAAELGMDWRDLIKPWILDIGGEQIRLGILLCEDSWEDDYVQRPLSHLLGQSCDLVLNLSASPFTLGKNSKRHRVFGQKVRAAQTPLIYVNQIGIQNNGKTIFAFDGRSTIYGNNGEILLEAPGFQEGIFHAEISSEKDLSGVRPNFNPYRPKIREKAREQGIALEFVLNHFTKHIGIGKLVIGASGGIDSAVSAALFARVLGPENILLVNMPSRFNSSLTKNLAKALAKNLGCYYVEIGIEDSITLTKNQIDDLEIDTVVKGSALTLHLSPFHFENIQARDRSSRILAAVACAFGETIPKLGCAFSCNANKAETTVGYSTLYGDHAGFLAPLADLWKGEVYELGRWLNEEAYGKTIIPEGIFEVVPSAELSDNQDVTQGKGDPLVYPYHDRLFFSWVQRWRRATPEENLDWWLKGKLQEELECEIDPKTIFPNSEAFIQDLERWWNLYCGMGVAKRIQAPPVIALSSRAFGFDHREHQGPAFYSTRYHELKRKALGG